MKKIKLKQFILLFGDISLLFASLYFALALRYFNWPTFDFLALHIGLFVYIFLFWLVIGYINNLYSLRLDATNSRFLELTLRSALISLALSVLFLYLVPNREISPKTNLLIFAAIYTGLFLAWRQTVNWLLRGYLPKTKLAFIGYDKNVQEIIDQIQAKPYLGYAAKLLVADNLPAGAMGGIRIVSQLADLPELLRATKASQLIINDDYQKSAQLQGLLFNNLNLKLTILSLTSFYEIVAQKIPIEIINQAWFLENLNLADKAWSENLKRIYDLAICLILGLLSLPAWPLIALAIKLDGPGKVFFKQLRVGQDNRLFKIYKFRTMKESTDTSPTTDNDSRVTRVGRFLRKSRLDELPQLLNILKNDMSFVGPRPEQPQLVAELAAKIPFYPVRHLIKPGITGWDQISVEYHSPSVEDTFKKLQYDLYYIKNLSPYLDLSIILKTIAIVISRQGR